MTGIKDDHCWVCGSEGADTLCPKCGHIVCRDCYDEATHRCLECIEEDITIKATRKKVMLIGGLLLVIVGLSTAAAGIVAGIPSEGVTVIFPFLVGDVSPWVAGLYSFLKTFCSQYTRVAFTAWLRAALITRSRKFKRHT